MALKRRTKVSASFNMSSMTDIVFLLLIFFMVTSTMVHPNAIKLLIPRKSTKTEVVREFTTVRVTAAGNYYLNGKRYSESTVGTALVNSLNGSEQQVIKLSTDKNVATGKAAYILDFAETNHVKVILDIK